MAKQVPLFVKNFQCIQKFNPILAKFLEQDFPELAKYHVSDSKSGLPTLSIEVGGKITQIHSKYDPVKEAFQQIKSVKFQNPRILIVLGFGMAYHIKAALEELGRVNIAIIIVEKDPNVVKLAMRHLDLSSIFSVPKFLWVTGIPENDAFSTLFELIKSADTSFQLFLKTVVVFDHPAISKIHGEYHRLMLKNFREAANQVILNYGNCPEDSLMGVENIMKNLGAIVKNPGIKDLEGVFKGVPGFVVSTGPSLDKNVKDLFGIEDRCVMICADSALHPLLKAGITPHSFATLERVIETVETYKTVTEDKMQEIWLGGTPVIRPEGYAAWKGPTFITYRDFAHFRWIDIPKGTLRVGMSCSNMAFKMLEYFGCNPIILVGQDCAFESIEKTHASGTRGRLIDPLKPEALYRIKGNYEEWVYTDMFFDLFRKAFVTDIAGFNGKVINCTAGGAYIEGSERMALNDAVAKYCTKAIGTRQLIKESLKYPTPEEIKKQWIKLYKTIVETIKEVKNVIAFCEEGVKKVDVFEKELDDQGIVELEDFLKRFPDKRVDDFYEEMCKDRSLVVNFGKYFNLYLMHIVQMIVIRFEMDFNELPSLCSDLKRCKLQAIRMMKKWFPTIRDVCAISLKLLEESFEDLKKEFGEI